MHTIYVFPEVLPHITGNAVGCSFFGAVRPSCRISRRWLFNTGAVENSNKGQPGIFRFYIIHKSRPWNTTTAGQGGVICENGHYAADQVYFYESSSKKSAKFSLSKNHRHLKNKYFCLKICKNLHFTLKNNCLKENSKFNFCLNFVVGPKMSKTFLTWSK